MSPDYNNPHVDHVEEPEACEACGHRRMLQEYPTRIDGHASRISLCDDCAEDDPRERGDDDGREYADPRDEMAGVR